MIQYFAKEMPIQKYVLIFVISPCFLSNTWHHRRRRPRHHAVADINGFALKRALSLKSPDTKVDSRLRQEMERS